jgi:hypothetical protein
MGRRPVVALVADTVLLASVVVVSVTAGTKRRVILYGDSLAFEARNAFAAVARKRRRRRDRSPDLRRHRHL